MTIHELDPEGDVLLTLRNPNAPFAVGWDNDIDWASERVPEEPVVENVKPDVNGDVQFRLSSKHLILASGYFKRTLKGIWKEGICSDGCYCIDAEDWDEEAMFILMQVIHGLNRKVPRLIALEKLAKIAVLVDYYDCHEAVTIWSELWIAGMKRSQGIPETCNRDLILCTLVASVFEEGDLFKKATKVAVEHCREDLPTLGLPIIAVAEKVKERRQESVRQVFTGLKSLLGLLRDGIVGCKFECSSILLGALTIQMHAQGILDPEPEPPYPGYSIISIKEMLKNFENPKWKEIKSSYAHYCSLRYLVDKHVSFEVEGLELSNIRP